MPRARVKVVSEPPDRIALTALAAFPGAYMRDVLHMRPYLWQRRAARTVWQNQLSCFAGATSIGKGKLEGALGLSWVHTRPFSNCLITSASEKQLMGSIAKEIAAYLRANLDRLHGVFNEPTADGVTIRGYEKEWFISYRVANAQRDSETGIASAENLAGFYAPGGVLALVDEASSPKLDAAIDTLEGSATRPDRKLALWGNTLRISGRFAGILTKPRKAEGYARMRIPYWMSPATGGIDPGEVLTPEQMAERAALRAVRELWRRTKGEGSPYYMARALALVPTLGEHDAAIPYHLIEKAMARALAGTVKDDPSLPVIIGIDAARFGDDECSMLARRGWKVLEQVNRGKTSGPEMVGMAIELAERWSRQRYSDLVGSDGTRELLTIPRDTGFRARDVVYFVVDESGLGGAGVVDPLAEQGWEVFPVDANATADDEERYRSITDEAWMEHLVRALRRCDFPIDPETGEPDEILASQLATRKYRFTGKAQQRRLISKDEMRTKGQESPDRGDAKALAFIDLDALGGVMAVG